MKVIELTLWMLGPLAGAMLGDLGADVVKIENPRRPDSGRNLLSNAGFDMTLEDGRSLMFEAMNRNKRGMALDLSTEAGKAVLLELVRDADVVLENFRPGALDRLGVGYERLKEIHPKLIYASASGHGFAGPDAGRPALDPVGQARSGLMWTHGGPQDGPNWHSLALADSMGANMLAYGVVAALAARDRTGVGEKVEVSHMMGSIWLSYWAVAASMLQGIAEWPRFDRHDAANPLFKPVPLRGWGVDLHRLREHRAGLSLGLPGTGSAWAAGRSALCHRGGTLRGAARVDRRAAEAVRGGSRGRSGWSGCRPSPT